MKAFGERLKQLRLQKGLSQAQISEILGVTQPSYSLWESGSREPSLSTVCAIADYFGVSLDHLFGRDADVQPLTAAEIKTLRRLLSALKEVE